jgi:hypothetical protein
LGLFNALHRDGLRLDKVGLGLVVLLRRGWLVHGLELRRLVLFHLDWLLGLFRVLRQGFGLLVRLVQLCLVLRVRLFWLVLRLGHVLSHLLFRLVLP